MAGQDITRDQLAELLNEDLSREYQAIISYVVYSQVLKGAEYMSIAAQLEERKDLRVGLTRERARRELHQLDARVSRQQMDRGHARVAVGPCHPNSELSRHERMSIQPPA